MSRRFGNPVALLMLGLAFGLVAACGSSGSRPAAPARGITSDASVRDAELSESERSAETEDVAEARVAETNQATAASAVQESAAADEQPGPLVLPPLEVPDRIAASYEMALDAMRRSDWLEAELALKQLILEPINYPGPYINLAIVYRQNGRIDEAFDVLQQVLAIWPEHAVALGEIGVVHRGRGEFAEAEAAYRRSIASNPGYALAHYNLGVLLDLYLQRQGDALDHYETYQSLLASPDEEVGRWIVDLRRRLDLPQISQQVAQEN